MADAYQEWILANEAYFNSLISDIHSAQISIDMEVYIFAQDMIGKKIADALIDAAKRKVAVRLLLDGIGSRDLNELQTEMEENGVQVKVYHPLFWSNLTWLINLKKFYHNLKHTNSRNHRKTCMIDKKILYIGSANIVDPPLINGQPSIWHDLTIKTVGLDLQDMQLAFDMAWGCVPLKMRFLFLFKKINIRPILRLNFSWKLRRALYQSLLKRIKNAKQRIYITSAYFVPRKFVFAQIILAAKRGVDVCIVVPSNFDVIGMSLLMSSFYAELIKAGAHIYQYRDGILHVKFLIIDDWFCLGTSNFNHRSVNQDLEVDQELQTESAKKALLTIFMRFRENANPVVLADLKKQSVWAKIVIGVLLMVRRFF